MTRKEGDVSQRTYIMNVKLDQASMYVGQSSSKQPQWTRNPEKVLRFLCDAWRSVFNACRAHRMEWEYENGVKTGEHSLGKHTDAMPRPNTQADAKRLMPWLRGVPSMLLHSAIRQENTSWYAGLKRKKQIGGDVPGMRRRNHSEPMFMMYARNGDVQCVRYSACSRKRGVIEISGINPKEYRKPGEPAKWRLRIFIQITEPIREFTSVIVHPDRGTVVFVNLTQPRRPIPDATDRGVTGGDVGCVHTLTTSDGVYHDIPQPTKRERKRLLHLQRKISRQDRINKACGIKHVRDSKRRENTRREYNKLVEHIANRKKDWVEKTSLQLTLDNTVVALEDIKPKRMTRRAQPKPDPEHPGQYLHNGATAKTGLNRSILSNNWGMLRTRIQQKGRLYQCDVILVNPAYTSQTCSMCGYTDKRNRKSQAVFQCVRCGHTDNADHNAGRVIIFLALGWQPHHPTPDEGSRRGATHRAQPAMRPTVAQGGGNVKPVTIPEIHTTRQCLGE